MKEKIKALINELIDLKNNEFFKDNYVIKSKINDLVSSLNIVLYYVKEE